MHTTRPGKTKLKFDKLNKITLFMFSQDTKNPNFRFYPKPGFLMRYLKGLRFIKKPKTHPLNSSDCL